MTWASLADDAITAYEAGTPGKAQATACILRAIAYRSGWSDPRVGTYLADLYALRNPDGGWGLNVAWDGFQDNTTNPATTSYTITMADHVGPVLLDIHWHDSGLVPASDIDTLVSLLMTTQTAEWSTIGKCIAYSRSSNDNVSASNGRNVHNVNAAAAGFLHRCLDEGFTYAPASMRRRVSDMLKHVATFFNPKNLWWPYKGTTGTQDTDHNGATAEFLWLTWPDVAQEVAFEVLSRFDELQDNAKAPIAAARLAGLGLEWRSYAQLWIGEVEDLLNATTDATVKAQLALWCARAASLG
jgi:hypothetical protein